MKLKTLDKAGLLITFIFGGLFGFTDYNGPRDTGTFLGSAMVVTFISLGLGWVSNKILRLWTLYRLWTGNIEEKFNATIAISAICSLIILVYGIVELTSY